jgi:AAA15 family ATPase/GTPase
METFHVKNYKGLKDLELNGLSRVSLIVGRNNVGKSSLLEALSLCISGGSVTELLEILDYGGERVTNRPSSMGEEKSLDNESHFQSLFHRAGFVGKRSPVITFTDEESVVKIEIGYQKDKRIRQGNSFNHVVEYVNETEYLESVGKNGVTTEKGIAIWAGESFQFIPFHREFQVFSDSRKCIFVRPVDYFLVPNAALYDKIAMTEKEEKLLSALRIIEPEIRKINYLESEPGSRKRAPFVVVGPNSERVRLSTMGDGINRILTIILSLLNCPSGGALCLDEIDNGLHFSVQKQLWEMVFSLARELDVQVFATTHSMDCIRSFAQVNVGGDGLLIRLDARQNGDIVPQYYSDPEEIRFAVESQIELR